MSKLELCNEKSLRNYAKDVYPFNPMGDAEMPIYTEIPKEFEDLCIYYGGSAQPVIETGTTDAKISISDNTNPDLDPEIFFGYSDTPIPKDATICITKTNYKPVVYQVISTNELLDFYQEIPLKEGYKKIHVAQLYPDQYNILDNSNSVGISAVSCSNGTMHVELEGNILPKTSTLSLRNIMGTDTYNYPISSLIEDFNVGEMANGIYVLLLNANGMEIDSQKILIK